MTSYVTVIVSEDQPTLDLRVYPDSSRSIDEAFGVVADFTKSYGWAEITVKDSSGEVWYIGHDHIGQLIVATITTVEMPAGPATITVNYADDAGNQVSAQEVVMIYREFTAGYIIHCSKRPAYRVRVGRSRSTGYIIHSSKRTAYRVRVGRAREGDS